jgi:hypothetical protein
VTIRHVMGNMCILSPDLRPTLTYQGIPSPTRGIRILDAMVGSTLISLNLSYRQCHRHVGNVSRTASLPQPENTLDVSRITSHTTQ